VKYGIPGTDAGMLTDGGMDGILLIVVTSLDRWTSFLETGGRRELSTATVAPITDQWPLPRTAVSPVLCARPVLRPLSGWQGVCQPRMDPVSRRDHGA